MKKLHTINALSVAHYSLFLFSRCLLSHQSRSLGCARKSLKTSSHHIVSSALLILALGISSIVNAALVLVDDFDNNSLDPAWNVSFTGAAIGWTGGESGTRLSAIDINNGDVTDSWGYVNFSQNLDALSDFNITYTFGREGDQIANLANNFISLYDSSDARILLAGTTDAWTYAGTQRIVYLNDLNVGAQTSCGSTWTTALAPTGFNLSISRVAGNIDATVGGCLLSGFNDTAVARIEINFGAYGQHGFGSEYADYISVDATSTSPVPAPAAVWLFGSGLIGLIGFAKRKKNNV